MLKTRCLLLLFLPMLSFSWITSISFAKKAGNHVHTFGSLDESVLKKLEQKAGEAKTLQGKNPSTIKSAF